MKFIYTLLLFLLSGCSNMTPHPRDTMGFYNEMKALSKGMSQEEVLEQVGEPDSSYKIKDKTVWVYWRQQLSVRRVPFYKYYTGNKVADSYYKVFFDKNGIMTGMGIENRGYRNEPPAEKRQVKDISKKVE